MSKTYAEAARELDEALADVRTALLRDFASTRVARFLGRFYEWERARVGDRLVKVATIILAANILWIWPIAIIEALIGLIRG